MTTLLVVLALSGAALLLRIFWVARRQRLEQEEREAEERYAAIMAYLAEQKCYCDDADVKLESRQ
jgi:hypothetical protein